MHSTQAKILQLAKRISLHGMTLRQIGTLVDEPHPQKVKHHLEQLAKKGLLAYRPEQQTLSTGGFGEAQEIKLVKIPMVGAANCGPASLLAQENIRGYLWIPNNFEGLSRAKDLVAVKAVGNSMNAAQSLPGGTIQDGDYVLVDCTNRSPRNGDYVLSIIDDAANIKRFFQNKETGEIELRSESTESIPPIIILESTMPDYLVNGVVTRVLKRT